MISRRGLLGLLAGATLDPERLLWRPGKRLISIPKPVIPWRLSVAILAPAGAFVDPAYHDRLTTKLVADLVRMKQSLPVPVRTEWPASPTCFVDHNAALVADGVYARVLRTYDVLSDRFILRADTLVRPL